MDNTKPYKTSRDSWNIPVKSFDAAEVFGGMYDIGISDIPTKMKAARDAVADILKIKAVEIKQIQALSLMDTLTYELAIDSTREAILRRWTEGAVADFANDAITMCPVKMSYTERHKLAEAQYSELLKIADILKCASEYWRDMISTVKNILYAIRNDVQLKVEGFDY